MSSFALFGDEAPMTAPAGSPNAGRYLVRVDPADWSVHRLSPRTALHRPIDVAFNPADGALYILDFGDFEMSEHGVQAQAATGKLWRWTDWAENT